MDDAWDVLAELIAHAFEWGGSVARTVREKRVVGSVVLSVLVAGLLIWYIAWCFWDQGWACDWVEKKCLFATYDDPYMQRVMDAACVARRPDCDAQPWIRGPKMLLHDLTVPVLAFVRDTIRSVVMTHWLTIIALGAIIIAAGGAFTAADKMIFPVFRFAGSLVLPPRRAQD